MIKIRYGLLPEGLHAEATRQGRRTILRLRPGLSSEQRRDALRRARQHGRMGHGPRLPAAGLAWALGVDRVTCTARNTVAAVRCHPLGAGMIAALLTGAIVCYSLFVTVSVRYLYPGATGTPPALPGPVPTVSASPSATAKPHGSAGVSPRSSPGTPAPQPGGSMASLTAPAPGTGAGTGTGPGSGSAPGPSSAPPSPAVAPAPTTPAPSPSPTSSALCLDVGPLGVCLKL